MFYKNYLKYIIPSVISFTLTGIYSIVDGYFIGQTVGDLGLAAVNLAWPVASVTYAAGAGLGMGGSVISSIRRGEGRFAESNNTIGTAFSMIIITAVAVTAFIFSFADIIITAMGAEGLTREYGILYLRTLAMGAAFQIGGCGLMPIIRSLGKPVGVMISIIAGCIVNIVMDWYLVMHLSMGVRGAALATISGEAVSAVPFVIFFLIKKNRLPVSCLKLKAGIVRKILKIGISPFGLTILPSISILLINLQALRMGGDTAVAAYAVISYVLSIIQLIIQGISEGAQPILSFNTGKGERPVVLKTAALTFAINIAVGLTGAVCLIYFSGTIAFLYNTGPETTMLLLEIMPVFAAVMPLYGFSRTTADFLYAVNRPFGASVIVYSEGLILMPALLIILPELFGLSGVWAAPLTTQSILLVLGLFLLFKRSGTKK
ncbi:MAG: MATE family efflux transporter [Bacillota bacterium]|nr:MATE family efflux transporter [Bacillota bacterium]